MASIAAGMKPDDRGCPQRSGHQAAVQSAELAEKVRKLEREVRSLRAAHSEAQMTLAGLEPVALLGGIKV